MEHAKEMTINIIAYIFATIGIAANLENIKSIILFFSGFILLLTQIIYYMLKIYREFKNKDKE